MQIKDRKSDLGLLEALDSGKPLDEANADMVASIVCNMIFSVTEETR